MPELGLSGVQHQNMLLAHHKSHNSSPSHAWTAICNCWKRWKGVLAIRRRNMKCTVHSTVVDHNKLKCTVISEQLFAHCNTEDYRSNICPQISTGICNVTICAAEYTVLPWQRNDRHINTFAADTFKQWSFGQWPFVSSGTEDSFFFFCVYIFKSWFITKACLHTSFLGGCSSWMGVDQHKRFTFFSRHHRVSRIKS